MNRIYQMVFLIALLLLNFSCTQNQPPENDRVTSEFAPFPPNDTLKFTSGIRAILQDRQGNYWIGSHNEGVCRFDGETFAYFTTQEGLSDNQVRSIQEDANGHLWLGTANGVSHFDGQQFTSYFPALTSDSQRTWNQTDQDLWFNAGNSQGVYRFDGQEVQFLAFPPLKTINPNNLYAVTGISAGQHNMLWIATYAGVIGYDGETFTVINDETLNLDKEKGVLHVRSILEDSKGRLWIGNNGIGVLLREGNTTINFSEQHQLIHANSPRAGDPSPTGTLEHVFAIEEDAEGNIWFGDRDTGAWKFDGTTMTNYVVNADLPSPMIWTIYNDPHDNLLFGMADRGIYRFNGDSFDKIF